ncbi:MAG: sodium:panthothenate symporter, partial [Victivallaceae bacterium]
INRGAWIGNDASACGRTAHEQKMAGVLGAWRNGFAWMMMTLLALFLITVMHADSFKNDARAIRTGLVNRVAGETLTDSVLRQKILDDIRAIPPQGHQPGVTPKLSKNHNPDLLYLNQVKSRLDQVADREIAAAKLDSGSSGAATLRGEQNANFQKFRTLYYQMMTPTLLRSYFPVGLAGAFVLLMIMLMLSSDDSRIFNAAATLVQDVVMPFRKTPFETREHLLWLRGMSVAVAAFFFAVSIFFSQLDYINMFINIMCSLWLGAAGPIMLGGLYSRRGTTAGAFAALVFGSGTAVGGLFCQRNWADTIYPFLQSSGYLPYLDTAFRAVSSITAPYVVWEMTPQKFPVNSYEIYFLAMILGIAGYTVVSFLTCKQPYDLDKLLYRGKYAENAVPPEPAWSWKNVYGKLIGITSEYTTGDKVIAWSVFGYAIVYQFILSFLAVLVWNLISPWPAAWWSTYFFVTVIVVGIIVGVVSTVWFMWGGIIDLNRLFKDLANRAEDPHDDGWVPKN